MQEKAEEIKKDLIKYDGYSEEQADKLVKSAVKMAEAGRNKRIGVERLELDEELCEYCEIECGVTRWSRWSDFLL